MATLTKFELLLLNADWQIRLPCVARHTRETGNRHVIHAEFDELKDEQQLAVKALVALLHAEGTRLAGMETMGAAPPVLRTTMLKLLARHRAG